jgi:hypothetical protein
MSPRCEGCPASPDHACHALAAGLNHWCLQRLNDPALDRHIAAQSRPGIEPERQAVEATTPTQAAPYDPRLTLIDLCPFLASCSCGDRRKCLQSSLPAIVGRADCLACVEATAPP